MPTLDLTPFIGRSGDFYLGGKNKGRAVRKELGLDMIDEGGDMVAVIVPDSLDCNESFVAGLFSNSISQSGSRAAFLNKYKFSVMPDQFAEHLNNVISATLSDGTALSGLTKK